jgi:hypothetical protein
MPESCHISTFDFCPTNTDINVHSPLLCQATGRVRAVLFVHKAQNLWYNFLVMTVVNGKFEWDSEKDEINKSKHGFSFSEILDMFDDPFFLERYDTEHSSLEEDRYIGLGESGGAIIVMSAYTERERTRIISARLATETERKLYYDQRANY